MKESAKSRHENLYTWKDDYIYGKDQIAFDDFSVVVSS